MILDHSLGCVECGGKCRGLGGCNDTYGMMDLSIPANYKNWIDCSSGAIPTPPSPLPTPIEDIIPLPVVVANGSVQDSLHRFGPIGGKWLTADEWNAYQQGEAKRLASDTTLADALKVFDQTKVIPALATTGGSIAPSGSLTSSVIDKVTPGINFLKTEGFISGVPNWVLLGVGVLGILGMMGKEG